MADNNHNLGIAINKIATHINPHIDEICAIWLLRRFGGNRFPGITDAPVEFWGDDSNLLIEQEYLCQKTLLVGIGGGWFDEHPTIDGERKKNKCAATLVAEYLGLDDDPALEMILEFVKRNDLDGSSSISELGSVCWKMYNIMPAEKVMNWATLGLEAIYREQTQFAQQAVEEYRKARVMVMNVRNGSEQAVKVAIIESDNEVVARFARAKRGGNATVVIQKNSSGNVQIFANRRFNVNMEKIARFIRTAEQKANGKRLNLKQEEMEREGKVLGAEEWYFFTKGRMLLNGSISHPDEPPTNLPLDEITRIVTNCLWH